MAHLHVLLATESPSALLIKRGPGRCSGTIGWDRRTDRFEVGQWMKKRLDYYAADLSPDGDYFVSYVNTQRWGEEHSVYLAVSRAPWLKALMFWSTDSWTKGPGTGMFFRDVDGVVKLLATEEKPHWDHLGMPVVAKLPDQPPWSTMVRGRYLWLRLQRDGWTAAPSAWEKCPVADSDKTRRGEVNPPRMVFEKPLPHGWKLRQAEGDWHSRQHNQPSGFMTFDLVTPDGKVLRQTDWEWAEFDAVRNRLVWTADCILYAAGITPDGPRTANLLLDTRGMGFEPREAPY